MPEDVLDPLDGHWRRASRLAWGNVIQFLSTGGGDTGQLGVSALDAFDLASMAVTEGTGLMLTQRVLPLDEETAMWLGVAPQPVPAEPEPVDDQSPWHEVLQYLDRDDSTLELLVQQLARQNLPAPVVGYELGDQGWQAELAWPERRNCLGGRYGPTLGETAVWARKRRASGPRRLCGFDRDLTNRGHTARGSSIAG